MNPPAEGGSVWTVFNLVRKAIASLLSNLIIFDVVSRVAKRQRNS